MPSRFSPPSHVQHNPPRAARPASREKERKARPLLHQIQSESGPPVGEGLKAGEGKEQLLPIALGREGGKGDFISGIALQRWQKRSGMLKAGSSPAQKGTNNWFCGNKAHLPRKISLVYAKELPDKTGPPPFYDTRQGRQNGKLVNVLDLSNKNVVMRSCGHRANRRRIFLPTPVFSSARTIGRPSTSRQPPRPERTCPR